MQLALPVTEAYALAVATGRVPPLLLAVRADAATIEADIDAGAALGGGGGLGGLLGRAAGTVTVAATFVSFDAGTAVFGIAARARGLSLGRLLSRFGGMIPELAERAGLPPDVAELRPDGPVLVVHVQRAVEAKVRGVVVQDLAIGDGVLHVTAQIADARPA